MTNGLTINNRHYNVIQLIELAEVMCNNANIPAWEMNIFRFIIDWFDGTPFITQKTSGSTGIAKEVQLAKSAMISSAKKTIEYFDLQKNDAVLLCLPVSYIAGKMMVVRTLIGNLNLLTVDPKGTPEIPETKIAFAAMVPIQIQKLVETENPLQNIEKLIIGGAEISRSLERSIQNLQTAVYSTYGMTETCSHIAVQRINGENRDPDFVTLSGIKIASNELGCLKIDAPLLSPEPIQTTDIVEIVDEKHFSWIGRADNVINSGGIKISPEQLEKEINEFISSDFIISSVKDPLLGNKVVLVIEGYEDEFSSTEIIEKIKAKVGSHRCPKEVLFLHQLPRNGSMKIDRKAVSKAINSGRNL